ncbi:hypothetical protein DFH29DRAFT_997951 [Suillus ampliporus]|nr:hypothetical protein DFH29DRAFT_997951 [Suillus ampliporus]
MSFSDSQHAAILAAQQILENVGLSPRDLDSPSPSPAPTLLSTPLPPPPEVLSSCYQPPPARAFTADELSLKCDQVNRETCVQALVEHPLGAIVEYPETGACEDSSVAHIFNVNPNPDHFINPKLNFQYSLGDGHGGRKNLTTSCKGLKLCSSHVSVDISSHHFTNRHKLTYINSSPLHTSEDTAEREVFLKTISFFYALKEKGCTISLEDGILECESADLLEYDDDDADIKGEFDRIARASRRPQKHKACKGALVLVFDKFNQPLIQCEHFSPSQRAHLVLRNLQEYDIPYLHALLDVDQQQIHVFETRAQSFGYGPLVPCRFAASPVEQKQLCRKYFSPATRSSLIVTSPQHIGTCDIDGSLRQGVLQKWAHKCQTTYVIYVPNDLQDCPHVLVISHNPHSHPPPMPVKTPPPILRCFESLLLHLEWKLADATPRRIMLDSGFMDGLRRVLGWSLSWDHDPTLQDLHPSLGNLDLVWRRINVLRNTRFPDGTGFDGAKLLANEQNKLPLGRKYVRCTETHIISQDTEFKLVISVVSTRAFTTSQSVEAHVILFRRIFEIATSDTGLPVTFYHIHGCGIKYIVADGHRGQGLGLGMYCVELVRENFQFCMYEPYRRLHKLNPYDHLRHFYRLCITHFKRNILTLCSQVSKDVYNAMWSLVSAEGHPDIAKTLNTIQQENRKAKAWLKDKETAKFVLPAIYRPMSLIPLYIWKASPSTMNGNEQAHRNVNRDGINLTLLAGIMRGYQYDVRAMSSIDLHITHGINTRDREATHVHRAKRAVDHHVHLQQLHLHKYAHLDVQPTATINTSVISNHASTPLAITPAPSADDPVDWPRFDYVFASTDELATTEFENTTNNETGREYLVPLSSFSTLEYALTPGANIIDYRVANHQSVVDPATKGLTSCIDPSLRPSTFSTLRGALQ